MLVTRLTTGLILLIMLAVPRAQAGVIAEDLNGTQPLNIALFAGQAFTTTGAGPSDDITISFFSNVPPTVPDALGTAYIFSTEYPGTPAGLSSSVPGFVGASTGIAGGSYVFAPSLTLLPDTQYFLYSDTEFPLGSITGGSTLAGAFLLLSDSSFPDFTPVADSANFLVSGNVVPEPASALLLIPGLLFLWLGSHMVRLSGKPHQ